MRPLAASLSLMLALALPPAALAEDSDVGPRLTCVPRALRIGAAEMSGLRLQCSISGATGEQSFTISLDQTMADVAEAGAPPLGRETVCSGMLTDGTGACVGIVFNADSPAFGFAQ
ncbi:MAG TPA: hypothetical protein VFG86_27250, partial [Chloroflexota bacterium]|nr:hypothetical protein [Chloroflexota bacterium]